MGVMIERKVVKSDFDSHCEIKQNLEYWMSRSAEERVEAVEILRRQFYGDTGRLQRVARVVQQAEG